MSSKIAVPVPLARVYDGPGSATVIASLLGAGVR